MSYEIESVLSELKFELLAQTKPRRWTSESGDDIGR
jgi:hypothetical protein